MIRVLFIILLVGLIPRSSVEMPVPHTLIKGLAQLDWSHNEDRATLGVSAWYAWGQSSCGTDYAHCTPMVRGWQLPNSCYPQLLVGNEPVNQEPAGHPISVHDAVTSTLAIKSMCPNTQLIVANIFYGVDWLRSFFAEYKQISGYGYGTLLHVSGLRDLVGFHVYSNTLKNGIEQAMAYQDLSGYKGNFWVTEFGVTDYFENPPRPNDWVAFLKWLGLQIRIDRVYVWTNRGSGPEWDLVNPNGSLTIEGQQYRDWTPPTQIWNTRLPLVNIVKGYP